MVFSVSSSRLSLCTQDWTANKRNSMIRRHVFFIDHTSYRILITLPLILILKKGLFLPEQPLLIQNLLLTHYQVLIQVYLASPFHDQFRPSLKCAQESGYPHISAFKVHFRIPVVSPGMMAGDDDGEIMVRIISAEI
jgi:hypothetical protein